MEITLLVFLPVNHGLVNRVAAAARVKTIVCANETRETGRGIKSLPVLRYFVRLVCLFLFFQIIFIFLLPSPPLPPPPPPPCVLGVGRCVLE